ncbi:MAG: hypothetical protein HY615_05610 [Candidatus Rokubacteria bacterium]|nr:hypothetical protein [Candidatus Rokubacteria bacterium]
MTTILAILALAALFALFGLVMMRGRQGACGSGCSCAPLGQRGACSADADTPDCPLALRGPKIGGE